MKHDVFISYKSQDIQITKALVHFMEREGISCWYAPRNLDINDAGKDYDDIIVKAIKACRIVIVLLCDESLKSDWVKIEVTCAMKNNKFIIPYVIRELTVDNGLLNRLTTKHWIDAYPSPEKKFSILLNNIKTEINAHEKNEQYFVNETDLISDYDYDYEEGEILLQADDTEDAISAFIISAEKGNPAAKRKLCEIFFNSDFDLGLISAETWETVDHLAKSGHSYANFIMHTRFYQDFDSGLISYEYLKKAIQDKSIPEAYLRMGIHYGRGIGVKQNHTLEMHYYQKALEMGLHTSYSYIGDVYKTGNTKYERNIDLALDYYQKGEALNDRRSMQSLFYMLIGDNGHHDSHQARLIAQKAIDCGYDEGLVWMGDSFLPKNMTYDFSAYSESLDWYIKAVQKNIKTSYSSLSRVYWDLEQYETAVQWALTGATRNDIDSYYLLGHYYEHGYHDNGWAISEVTNEDLNKSWTFYLNYYLKSRNGAENLARLYLDKHYRNDNEFAIEDLIHYLEDCAKNSNIKCIEYLIRIFSDPYDKLQIQKYVKLGANVGIVEYMYQYALLFFEEEDKKLYNPYEGALWLEKGAQKKHLKSLDKLIELYSSGICYDAPKCEKWCDFAIENNMASPSDLTIIEHVRNSSRHKEEYTKYLLKALTCLNVTDKTRGEIYRTLISWHHTSGRELRGNTYDTLIKQVRDNIENNKSLSYAQGIINYLYPDFDYKELESGRIPLDVNSRQKYYLMNTSQCEIMVKEQDRILRRIYKDIIEDISFPEVCKNHLLIIREHVKRTYWKALESQQFNISIFKLHNDLCSQYECEPIDKISVNANKLHPVISSEFAIELREWATCSLLSMIRQGREPFNNISIISLHKEICNIYNKECDTLHGLYLKSFERLMFETEDVLEKNYNIMMQYIAKDYNQILSDLTEYKFQIEKAQIKHNLPDFNEEYISSIRASDDFYKNDDDFNWPDFDNWKENDGKGTDKLKSIPKLSDFPDYFTARERDWECWEQ